MQPIPNIRYEDNRFFGLDTRSNPVDVKPGFAVTLDNFNVESGMLVSRPGKQGQLAAALGQAIYNPVSIKQTDGQNRIWYASGTSLYNFNPAAGTHATVTFGGMASLTAANVSICQGAGYVYVADGTTSGLMRFGADGTAGAAYTGLTKPAKPTAVSLTNRPFIPTPGAVTWDTVDVASTQNLITAGNETPTAANTDPSPSAVFWESFSPGIPGDVDFTVFDGTSIDCVVLGGTVGAGIISELIPLDDDIPGGTVGNFPDVFDFQMLCRTKSGGTSASSRVMIRLYLYDDALGATTPEVITQYIGLIDLSLTNRRITFDHRDRVTKPQSIKIELQNANFAISGDDPQLGQIFLGLGGKAVALTNSAGVLQVGSGTIYAQPIGDACSGTDAGDDSVLSFPQETKLFTQDREFTYTLPVVKDMSKASTIAADIRLVYTNVPDGVFVPVQMFIQNAAGVSSRVYGEPILLSSGNSMVATLDVTTISAAVRSAITLFGFRFLTDIPTTSYAGDYSGSNSATGGALPATSPVLFEVTQIVDPGNLTPGTSDYYVIEEWNGNGDAQLVNVIISDGSDVSQDIIPTETSAVGVITLPARVNASAGYFALHRFGEFKDGLGRLVALLPYAATAGNIAYGADVAKGLAAPANPYIEVSYPAVAGNAGTVIIDNTPSLWLEDAERYLGGRQAPPAKILDMAFHMGRLFLLSDEGNGNTGLWASWRIYDDRNAGLYFTRVAQENDPAADRKGWYSGVGNADNDPGKRLMRLDYNLVILFGERAPAILNGDSPSTFSLWDYTKAAIGLGLTAKRAATVFRNAVWYLTSTGLVRFIPEGVVSPASMPIKGSLNPGANGAASPLLATAYKECAVWQAENRVYLAAPGSSADSANTVIYRFDPEEGDGTGAYSGDNMAGSWTRWQQGNVTGGVTLTGESDTNNHYVTGLDGQIHRYVNGAGDKATSGASETAIAVSLATRRYGGGQSDNERSHAKKSTEFKANVQPDASEASGIAVTFGVNGETGGNSWSQAWALADNSEIQPVFTKSAQGIKGRSLQITLSASVKKRFAVHSLGLSAKVGTDR